MACKRSKQCDHADLCRFAQSDDYNLLGGSCFTLKDPQTNEEWLKHCNTEQLAELLCDVWYGIDEVINIMSEDGEISKKDAMKLWLKQPHTEGSTK